MNDRYALRMRKAVIVTRFIIRDSGSMLSWAGAALWTPMRVGSPGRDGPEPTLVHRSHALPQLHQTSRSCLVQNFGAATDNSADLWTTCVLASALVRTAQKTSRKKTSAVSRAKMARQYMKHPPRHSKVDIPQMNLTWGACMPRSTQATIRRSRMLSKDRTCHQLIQAVNLNLK